MNWLNFDLKKALITLFAILLPLMSINMQQRPVDTGWYNTPFSYIGGLVQSAFFSFSDGVRGTTKLYLDLIDLKKESSQLKSQNHTLMAQLLVMEELKKENERLNQLLDFKQKANMELVAARVISRDLITEHATIQIDKGTLHGLKAGQAVITTQGALGHIFRPQKRTSHILLVTDRYSVVDGVVSRSRARGIVEGKNQGACALRYVEKSEDVKAGDLVVTSGLDNIYPKGFPVAVVKTVEDKPYAVSLKVELQPVVDADKAEEVFVITNANNQDLTDQMTMRKE